MQVTKSIFQLKKTSHLWLIFVSMNFLHPIFFMIQKGIYFLEEKNLKRRGRSKKKKEMKINKTMIVDYTIQ